MRLIGWQQLRQMQPYSRQHIMRLEKAGAFPRRVRLGPARVAWVYEEIVQHLQALAAQRQPTDTSG
jgi:prophage regulatory protein